MQSKKNWTANKNILFVKKFQIETFILQHETFLQKNEKD